MLFLLDEFAAMGRLPAVERAMGLMAGYGMQLWPILQDIHQLRGLYGRAAGTFFSNVAVLQTFNTGDFETASLLSNMVGQSTVSFNIDQLAARPLMTPDEILTFPENRLLIFVQGMRPIAARKLRYYDDPLFKGQFDALP